MSVKVAVTCVKGVAALAGCHDVLSTAGITDGFGMVKVYTSCMSLLAMRKGWLTDKHATGGRHQTSKKRVCGTTLCGCS